MSTPNRRFATVIVAYERAQSLTTLLDTVLAARRGRPDFQTVIVSVDAGVKEVVEAARGFEKEGIEVIARERRMGLKDHVLACGDLTDKFDSILLLEDDLVLSPVAYDFIADVLPEVSEHDRVAALSLYSFHFNEPGRLPLFVPDAPGDLFFAKTASSWGQVWWSDKWREFRDWLSSSYDPEQAYCVPASISAWPDTSWKKLFNFFLSDKGYYSAIPRYSLTLNPGTAGTHHANGPAKAFAPVRSTAIPSFRVPFEQALKLDEFHEYELDNLSLPGYDDGPEPGEIELDYFGIKTPAVIRKAYVLTSQRQAPGAVIAEYELAYGNPLLSLQCGARGRGLQLVRKRDFRGSGSGLRPEAMIRNHLAWLGNREMFRHVALESMRKLNKWLARLKPGR